MSNPNDSQLPLSLLQFYATAPYPCSYLPDLLARSQVATPPHLIGPDIYSDLVRNGFRRSGLYTYRPHCDACQDCLPVRIPVDKMVLNRSQRRCYQGLQSLTVRELPLDFYEHHFDLYRRYQATRHAGGGMDEDTHEQYGQFLLQSRVDTRLVEFRDGDTLRMVSIIDVLDDGLSSVYTFFDPDQAKAGLGTFNVLWQARQCQGNGLPYLYLGYYIRKSRKMAYKANFRPLEAFQEGSWMQFSS